MEIVGDKLTLVPIGLDEREAFYKLAMESHGSRFWHDAEEKERIGKEKFFQDWHEGYFDLSKPSEGQCFWIVFEGENIGQVNYNKLDSKNKNAELDIIIGDEENMGRGYGTDALRTLAKYLFDTFDLHKVIIEARANNPRAVTAYEKAGFKREGLLRDEDYFQGAFVDCIRFGMLKEEQT